MHGMHGIGVGRSVRLIGIGAAAIVAVIFAVIRAILNRRR
jgi:hypothetical protein